jgi:hypothetical protein
MKVKNMEGKNGQAVPNQFIIMDDSGNEYFQSYDSMIAVKRLNGDVVLDVTCWDYSTTTGKYRNQFLGEKKAETIKKINSGIYKLEGLN